MNKNSTNIQLTFKFLEEVEKIPLLVDEERCPLCDTELFRNGRCQICVNCGWSACEL